MLKAVLVLSALLAAAADNATAVSESELESDFAIHKVVVVVVSAVESAWLFHGAPVWDDQIHCSVLQLRSPLAPCRSLSAGNVGLGATVGHWRRDRAVQLEHSAAGLGRSSHGQWQSGGS